MYKVLIVEDDTALRFIYKKMKTWSECGFTIAAEAANGRKALELLEQERFDLIFTDIRMPFIDGIEMLRKLNELGNTTPVVFASSYDEFEYARQGLILGAFDYLLKPVEHKKLAEVLERVREKLQSMPTEDPVAPAVTAELERLGIHAEDSQFIRQVALFCSERYGELFTVDDIAESCGYSKDYFGKIFKQSFGTTFHEFYARLKVAYAIDLLKTGNYKTYEISELLGYASVDYFTRVFKEITGVTPSKYKSGEKK